MFFFSISSAHGTNFPGKMYRAYGQSIFRCVDFQEKARMIGDKSTIKNSSCFVFRSLMSCQQFKFE